MDMDNGVALRLSKSFSVRAIYRALDISKRGQGRDFAARFEAWLEADGVAYNVGSSAKDDKWSVMFLDLLEKVERLMFLEALLDEMRDSRVAVDVQERYFIEAKALVMELYPEIESGAGNG